MDQKKQIFVIVGLLIALVVVWVLVLRPPVKKNISQTEQEESGVEFKLMLEMADKYLTNKKNVQEFSYEKDRDPFSPERIKVVGEKKIASDSLKELTLKGILWDSQKPLAIINDEVVGTGSFVKGIKVKRIEPDHIVLEVGGEENFLFIEGAKDKKEDKILKSEYVIDEKKEDSKPKSEGITDEKNTPTLVY
jgi:hypothetical protein